MSRASAPFILDGRRIQQGRSILAREPDKFRKIVDAPGACEEQDRAEDLIRRIVDGGQQGSNHCCVRRIELACDQECTIFRRESVFAAVAVGRHSFSDRGWMTIILRIVVPGQRPSSWIKSLAQAQATWTRDNPRRP
ncbi:MAG: hypothetical protein JNM58_13970 [Xanthomonadaceae bacterium]|nr:hypothetical protein [Xanthomonadaceae bacterium]